MKLRRYMNRNRIRPSRFKSKTQTGFNRWMIKILFRVKDTIFKGQITSTAGRIMRRAPLSIAARYFLQPMIILGFTDWYRWRADLQRQIRHGGIFPSHLLCAKQHYNSNLRQTGKVALKREKRRREKSRVNCDYYIMSTLLFAWFSSISRERYLSSRTGLGFE